MRVGVCVCLLVSVCVCVQVRVCGVRVMVNEIESSPKIDFKHFFVEFPATESLPPRQTFSNVKFGIRIKD